MRCTFSAKGLFMETLLVLGIVPGTNLQISFSSWLVAASLLLIIFSWKQKTHYKLPLRHYLLLTAVYGAMRLGRAHRPIML